MEILFLSLEDTIQAGASNIVSAAKDMQTGFKLFKNGKILQPAKTSLRLNDLKNETNSGLVNILPAAIDNEKQKIFSCKCLGAMPSNVENGIPRATGVIVLFDNETKTPACIMDAQAISATRTGAVSLLAAEKLVDKNTKAIGLIGAGVNMRTQLLGLEQALPKLESATVYSRGKSKHEFAREMSKRTGIDIRAVDTPKEAVHDKQMIVTCAANVTTPIVKREWLLEEGLTCFNIGCYEFEANLLKNMNRIVSDYWEHSKHRGVQTHAVAWKQGIITDSQVEDLAPILMGETPGRRSKKENIFFCPTGLGFEDALVAQRVYNKAIESNIGKRLQLWQNSKWI